MKKDEKIAIIATLDDYAKAYCDKDIDALMQVFDDSNFISVIGTGADELCQGQDSVRGLFLRNFSEATAKGFNWQWTDIIVSTNHAVVAVSLTIALEYQDQELTVPIR